MTRMGADVMQIKETIRQIVGQEGFSDEPQVLDTYASDFSLVPPRPPSYVARPKEASQVQQLLRMANEYRIPVVPISSHVHFYGATIPKQGGIALDLKGMDRVLELDTLNRRVRVEPGVTWQRMVDTLAENGFRIIMPLLPHPLRSVVTDVLEREVPTNTVYDYGEPLQSMEVVWPNGEIFRTGSASVRDYPDTPSKGANPSGPGLDFYRFLQGAQGTFGVVTWANLKVEYLPKQDKVLLAPIQDLGYAISFLYRVLRLRIGQECLLLNNINLASVIAEDWSKDFEKLRTLLPPWTLILVLSGLKRRPDEKIKYEEDELLRIVKNEYPEINLKESLPGLPRLGPRVLELLRKPWPQGLTYWKHRYKGACQSLFFIARPADAPCFIKTVQDEAAKHGYPKEEIGCYFQPIEHNRACHLEFNFFYDKNNPKEVETIRNLYREAARLLLAQGALFTRPYGELAKLVYERATSYATALRRVKKIFDPNNVMNPGNLCF